MKSKMVFLGMVLVLFSCSKLKKENSKESDSNQSVYFKEVLAEHSNITFSNIITESTDDNWLDFDYFYNGGGVAIGDINNDGLSDIYFTGNQVKDRLYLNKGNLIFEDITDKAIKTGQEGWHNGVSMADVNGDGLLDIYVCRSGYTLKHDLTNLLYINNGDLTFTERAKEFGLNDGLFSTQAAFFDADLDGDLDAYVMNYPFRYIYRNKEEQKELFKSNNQESDHFYLNENGHFVNKSVQYGINNHAHGLGIGISDIDDDGYPDIYISDDLASGDFLYMNKNGHFKDEIKSRIGHTSFYGMGIDIADFNNDGTMDIMQLDMAFSDHVRSKRGMDMLSIEHFWNLVEDYGNYQYMQNTFQLNNGNGTFSDIAQLAGVSKTNWSWASLLADLDNDGYKDLFVTNGYKRDVKNLDNFTELKKQMEKGRINAFETLTSFESIKDPNKAYSNNKDLTFKDVTEEWGLGKKVNSNGVAYGDLDNDGDLDLVINNIDTISSIYENTLNEKSNYLSLQFKGKGQNTFMIGTKVSIYIKDSVQVQELFPTRGFLSSVEPKLHFGLGKSKLIDKIEIRWPDKKTTVLKNVNANQHLKLDYSKAKFEELKSVAQTPIFKECSKELNIDFIHTENYYNDFDREILIPHMLSRLGPCIEVADVNGDNLEDLFIGGARNSASALFIQNKNGSFLASNQSLFDKDNQYEDVGALFIDIDKDGDNDLYVASGGNDCEENDKSLQDRLYINDGKGIFTQSQNILSIMLTSTKAVKAIDFDKDMDLDLIVGGRLVPGKYPHSPRSYLLENNGGKFLDVTEKYAVDLKYAGQITGIECADFDNNGDMDFALVGEWTGLEIFMNTKGQFSKKPVNEATLGLWHSLIAGDIDNDGDMDLIGGNFGLNSKFKGSVEHPFNVYSHDFDDNGTNDIVLSKYQGEMNYPVRGKKCSSQQMPFINNKFPTFTEYSVADVNTIYGDKLSEALHLQVTNFASSVFLNDGSGQFIMSPLPIETQFSPVQGMILEDINKDGILDLIGAGNLYEAEVETVRYDSGRGFYLLGNGKGGFQSLSPVQSGLFTVQDVKSVSKIIVNGKPVYLMGVNNGKLVAFKTNE